MILFKPEEAKLRSEPRLIGLFYFLSSLVDTRPASRVLAVLGL